MQLGRRIHEVLSALQSCTSHTTLRLHVILAFSHTLASVLVLARKRLGIVFNHHTNKGKYIFANSYLCVHNKRTSILLQITASNFDLLRRYMHTAKKDPSSSFWPGIKRVLTLVRDGLGFCFR